MFDHQPSPKALVHVPCPYHSSDSPPATRVTAVLTSVNWISQIFYLSLAPECSPQHGFGPACLWVWMELFCILSFLSSMPHWSAWCLLLGEALCFIHSCCSCDYTHPHGLFLQTPLMGIWVLSCLDLLSLQWTFWASFSDSVEHMPRSRAAKSWRRHGLNPLILLCGFSKCWFLFLLPLGMFESSWCSTWAFQVVLLVKKLLADAGRDLRLET